MANGWKIKDPYDDLNNALNLINTIQSMNASASRTANALRSRHMGNMEKWIKLAANDPLNQNHLESMESKFNDYVSNNQNEFDADTIDYIDAAKYSFNKMKADNSSRINMEDEFKRMDSYYDQWLNNEIVPTVEENQKLADMVSNMQDMIPKYADIHQSAYRGQPNNFIIKFIDDVAFKGNAILNESRYFSDNDKRAILKGPDYFKNVHLKRKGETAGALEKAMMGQFGTVTQIKQLLNQADASGGIIEYNGVKMDIENLQFETGGVDTVTGQPIMSSYSDQFIALPDGTQLPMSQFTTQGLENHLKQVMDGLKRMNANYQYITDGDNYLQNLFLMSNLDPKEFEQYEFFDAAVPTGSTEGLVLDEDGRRVIPEDQWMEESPVIPTKPPADPVETKTKALADPVETKKVAADPTIANLTGLTTNENGDITVKTPEEIKENILTVTNVDNENIASGLATKIFQTLNYTLRKAPRNPFSKDNTDFLISTDKKVINDAIRRGQAQGLNINKKSSYKTELDMKLDMALNKKYGVKSPSIPPVSAEKVFDFSKAADQLIMTSDRAKNQKVKEDLKAKKAEFKKQSSITNKIEKYISDHKGLKEILKDKDFTIEVDGKKIKPNEKQRKILNKMQKILMTQKVMTFDPKALKKLSDDYNKEIKRFIKSLSE